MNPVTYCIALNTARPGSQVGIHLRRGDARTRRLRFLLHNDSEPYPICDGALVVLRARKSDDATVLADCDVQEGCALYTLDANMAAVPGRVACELAVYGGDNQVLFAPKFDLYVEQSVLDDADIQSTDDFSALSAALLQARRYETAWSNPRASAVMGDAADASVSVEESAVRFAFTLPRGEKGEKGDVGPRGEKGETGRGLMILGVYDSLQALREAVPQPHAGDCYGVGESAPYTLYTWDDRGKTWVDNGNLKGSPGDVFVPAVSREGELSWTLRQSPALSPDPVNIRGPQGEKGAQGSAGPMGPAGPNSISPTTASTLDGLLKGADGRVAMAVAGTDYVAPAALAAHTGSRANPHGVTAAQIGAIANAGYLPDKRWDIAAPGVYAFAPNDINEAPQGQTAPVKLNYKFGHLLVFQTQGGGVTQIAVSHYTHQSPCIAVRSCWSGNSAFMSWAYLTTTT